MVRPSFVPPPPIRALRELTRYRKTQVDARGREIQRLEKVLQDAGVKLTSVTSTLWSASSRQMVEALIKGEQDTAVLAQMAKGRMRPKIGRLEEALAGNFGQHHARRSDNTRHRAELAQPACRAWAFRLRSTSPP